ncbi:polyunsaturated fatty acid 5-lipoxygenase-like [Anguilla rostrata]|uniref:polyunsaturated fatty acid 5-lipoxygenase-like n=1 Tax=Anguilla rostrata TaxID=7938 RepID=UPI0030CFF8DF
MARYIVKVEPRPIDRIYIQFPESLGKKEYLIQDDTTIELNGEPKEITIRRESSWLRQFTPWRCSYMTVTSLDSEKECYFPVFREIYSAGPTIKENSAKLPQDDLSLERKESLLNNHTFQEKVGQHGKDQQVSRTESFTVVKEEASQESSTGKSLILSVLLGIISIVPEQLHFTHKPGLPGFVKGGNFFELPKELWFEPRKIVTLIYNTVKIKAQTTFRRLWNFCRKWKKIDDIRNVFWFPSKKAEYISRHWKEDAFYGSLFLNGCNPIMIKRYTEDQQKIPTETLEKVYPDIKENIQNGSIYVVDYEILDGIAEGIVDKSPQFLAAPIMLLQQTEEELKPIAIQLNQKPGENNPVFTPQDKPEAWLLAKIWVRNSDFYIHELVSHLLRTHLMGEIFFIASYSMADQHPLSKILRATGRYTLPINITARNTLINKGGFFVEHTGIGDGGQWEVITRATQEITYKSLCLPDDVKHRGIEHLKNFHYRDDAMAIWDAIYNFVREVVNGCYTDDEEIHKDPELQEMVFFIYNYGFLQKSDCPSSLKTREEAIKYITMIMFTCSAQHAAVNHGQYDIYAWMPNGPTTMRKPAPKDKAVTEKDIMDTLPDIDTTLESMKVANFLSQVSNDFVPLGQYPEEVAFEKHTREPILNFQSKLKEIEENIKRRSALQDFPYEYLYPAGMENSITI